MLNSTSSGFALATTMMWGVTASSLGTLEASWRGIDLVNVAITRSRGRLLASHPAVLRAWLLGPEGERINMCKSSEAKQVWLGAVASLHSGLPGVHHERDRLQLQGTFERGVIQLNWTEASEISMLYEDAIQVLISTSSGFALATTIMWVGTRGLLGTLKASWSIDPVNVTITRSPDRLQLQGTFE